MTDGRDERGELLPDEQWPTSFDRLLGSTSLNELPGLFNVFMGRMRLVGPRSLRMRYLNRYSPEQVRRHEVKPGTTG
jgi:sugar transferase EpsL